MNKRGEDVSYETIIFVILNTIFFFLLLTFVYRSASGAQIYEQSYAKQIGLLIDSAKPGMTISLNLGKLADIAQNKGLPAEQIVKIDGINKLVIVSASQTGGYSFQYFIDSNVSVIRFSDYGTGDRNLVIKVEGNNG